MDFQPNEKDFELLENDKHTFAVLKRILNGPCKLISTNHKNLIVCLSEDRFPVWLWTPDDANLEEKERAWDAVTEFFPITDGYRYNLKYDLADFFIFKAKERGINLKIARNMLAYECQNPIAPKNTAAGHIYLCGRGDLNEAAKLIKAFHEDTGINKSDDEKALNAAKKYIESVRFFFWKDDFERTVACCSYAPSGDLASVSGVYTIPEYRRNHYAENLVYQVSKIIKSAGLTPTLYTDADYAPSNACYEKIGYAIKGKLCTIEAEKAESSK